MSERRSYAFRDPAIAPRDQFLGDMGDEVAREFITLNPVLPREAFTIKNLIDYVARALQANMVHWGQKPVRWSFTIVVDNVPRELLAGGRDAKAALFYRLVELSEENDMYYVKASVREQLFKHATPPSGETLCTIITLLPRNSDAYGRGVLVETRKLWGEGTATVPHAPGSPHPANQAEVPHGKTAKEDAEEPLFLTDEDEDATSSCSEKRKHDFPGSKAKRHCASAAETAFNQLRETLSSGDDELSATVSKNLNDKGSSESYGRRLQSALAEVRNEHVKQKAQLLKQKAQQAELEKQQVKTVGLIMENAKVEVAILSAIKAYEETETHIELGR
ncbi:MAG: hypothetical protein Q9205_004892 [Flavoplaca limonia]